MGKIYSQSQGKFIDMPDTVAGGIGSEVPAGMATGVTGTTAPTPQAGGGQDVNTMLQQILLQAALKEPKYASRYSSILGMLGTINPPVSEAEKTRKVAKETANRIVGLLEDRYYGGGTTPKLAYGRVKGIWESLNAKIGTNPDLNSYLALRNSVRPTLVKAMGDVGNFSVVEQQWAIANVPTGLNTSKEAENYFRDLRAKLALPEKTYLGPKMPTSWQPD